MPMKESTQKVGRREGATSCRPSDTRPSMAVAALAFAEKWAGRGDEKQHSQSFWLELLREVYGIENPVRFNYQKELTGVSLIVLIGYRFAHKAGSLKYLKYGLLIGGFHDRLSFALRQAR